MARRFSLICTFIALGFLSGCSGSKAKPVPVSGTINLNGKALSEGSITLAGEGGAIPETFEVKDGKFAGEALPGKKRVEIRAYRPGKATKMGNEVIEATPENYLPSQYNTESNISAEVGASGLNPSTFEVKAK